MRDEEEILEWAEFVATKFARNHEGWVYSNDLGGLKHIRYERDYKGRNHWSRRFLGALRFAWRGNFSPGGALKRFYASEQARMSLWERIQGFWIYFKVRALKDSNLPDGQINGILTHWEEDGEYIMFFQPRVGMKVLEFLRSEPNHPHAKIIREEMVAVAELSLGDPSDD